MPKMSTLQKVVVGFVVAAGLLLGARAVTRALEEGVRFR